MTSTDLVEDFKICLIKFIIHVLNNQIFILTGSWLDILKFMPRASNEAYYSKSCSGGYHS